MKIALALLVTIATPAVADPVVMTAFAPEWESLAHPVERPKKYRINGLTFLTGDGGQASTADAGRREHSERCDEHATRARSLHGAADRVLGHRRWYRSNLAHRRGRSARALGAQYLEVSFARKTGDAWTPPEPLDPAAPQSYGMMFPRGVNVGNAAEPAKRHYAFPVDAGLLAMARKVATGVTLRRCVAEQSCLAETPKIVGGGTGVGASVYADNAKFRTYATSAYKADVVDMESAAVAQVAYANTVPVMIFRSLSDLAGSDAGANQMTAFMALAAANSANVVHAFAAALPN